MGSGGEFGMSLSGGLCAVLSLGCTSFGMHCETCEWISLKRLGESTVEWLAMIVKSMALLRLVITASGNSLKMSGTHFQSPMHAETARHLMDVPYREPRPLK